jgi:FkbM family methyltransferase
VRLGRASAPAAVALLEWTRASRFVGNAVRYLNVLQGLGGGSGWNVAGETRAMTTALRGLERPVIIDGGANWGAWTRAVNAALDAPRARYFLIEPQSACQEVIRNLPVKDLTIVQAALGAVAGAGVISARLPGFPAASLYQRRDRHFGDMGAHQEQVTITTVDDLVAQYEIDRIDLLKLDVEGAELAALQGAVTSLDKELIRSVAFEFGEPHLYSRVFFRDFWDLLHPRGFVLSRVLPGGRLRTVDHYREDLEHFEGVSNYLATTR